MNAYWIPGQFKGRLAIIPRPRGDEWLEDDIRILRQMGANVIVSMLTESESDEFGLWDENECCTRESIAFLNFAVEDRSVPSDEGAFRALIRQLVEMLRNGSMVLVHCRMGIGRSALVAACILKSLGESSDQAIKTLEAARGCPVPDTEEQAKWIRAF